jgi:hypothetical protein
MERHPYPGAWPAYYRITVRGTLGLAWSAWFDGLEIKHETGGNTTLSGPVKDDAELYGLISRARDLGLGLLAVARYDPES